MNHQASRRTFFRRTGRAGAALGAVTAFGAAGAATQVPLAAPRSDRQIDLLETLGTRIGLEVSDMIGSSGATLTLTVLDAAGSACDALREGLQAPIAVIGRERACSELQVPNAHTLAVATYRNELNGTVAQVEVFSAALSHIQMIEETAGSASAARRHLLAAGGESLYRISYA